MRQRRTNRAARGLPGFSAVELMIVILIIALLASILVPVLSRAYKTAMATADAALLHQIATGLDMYHQAFFDYPSSTFYNPVTSLFDPWPPPPVPAGGLQATIVSTGADPNRIILTGAAKVYAALSGFNATGLPAPAAAADRGCADADPANWTQPCGQLTTRGILVQDPSGAAFAERQPPYGPYYVPSDKQQTKTTISWGGTTVQQDVYASRFTRPNAPAAPAGGMAESGAPILYYRARPAPTDIDNSGVVDVCDIYACEDNLPITDPGRLPITPVTNPDRARHPLYAPSDGKTAGNTDWSAYPAAWGTPPATRFFGITRPFTKNVAGQTALAHNADSFILISPGPDGQYFVPDGHGNCDDITNFNQ
jgi:prepilin-type N-terminal cleavage/methylation domain-containing protein